MKEGGGNDLRLQAGAAIVGLSLLVSPLSWQYKIVVASIFGLSNSVVALRELRVYRRWKPQFLKELEELERTKRDRNTLLGEVEARRKQVEADLYVRQKKLEVDESAFNASYKAKIEQLERDLEALEELRVKAEKECFQAKKKAQNDSEAIASEIESKAQEKLKAAEEQLARLMELEADWRKELEAAREKVSRQRSRNMHRIRKVIIAARADNDIRKAELNAHKKRVEADIARMQEEWESDRQAQEEQRESQFLADLQERVAQAQRQLASENEETINNMVAAQVKPYIDAMDKQKAFIDSLQDQLAATREKMKAMYLPKLPEATDVLSSVARRLIEFYQKRGVILDFVNAYQTFTDVHVVVFPNPYHYPDGKGFDEGMITKNYDLLIPEFKLHDTPDGGWGGDGYDIRLTPRNWMFLGMTPQLPHNRLVRENFVNPLIEYPFDEHDLPEPTTGVNEAIEEINVNRMMDEMLGFVPPSQPFSKDDPITPIEVKTVDWYYRWRKAATNGAQPNITTINDLIDRVYGKKPGRNTRALSNRLKVIFEQLGLQIISEEKS